MLTKKSCSDAAEALLFFEDKLDTERSLWFFRDAEDVAAVEENAVCLASGADFSSFRRCKDFLKSFPSVFIALAETELRDGVVAALDECVPGLSILLPRDGAFGKHKFARKSWKPEE